MTRTYEAGPAKITLLVEFKDDVFEYDISQGPWTYRNMLCFVKAGDTVDTKVPLANVVEYSERSFSSSHSALDASGRPALSEKPLATS